MPTGQPKCRKEWMKSAAICGLGSALLSACSLASPMTPQEADIRSQAEVNQYMPASRDMRDNIETQDLFAQAAFWSHEYDLNPADLEASIKLAAAVRKLGNPSRAVEITQTSRAIHPRNPYLLAELAAALIADERAFNAMPVIDEALKVAPGYARLWSLRGAALDQTEQYEQARQSYNRALQITPNDPNILANMGLSYALSGDPQSAETWLKRAAALPGASAGVRQNLALVLRLQGKTDEAEQQSRLSRLSRGERQFPPPSVPALNPRQTQPNPQSQQARNYPPGTFNGTYQSPNQANNGSPFGRPPARVTTSSPNGQPYQSASEAARSAYEQRNGSLQPGYAPPSSYGQSAPNSYAPRPYGQPPQAAPQSSQAPQQPYGGQAPNGAYVVGPPLQSPPSYGNTYGAEQFESQVGSDSSPSLAGGQNSSKKRQRARSRR